MSPGLLPSARTHPRSGSEGRRRSPRSYRRLHDGQLHRAEGHAHPFSYLQPQQRWQPSRVTVLGDAAHGMLPTKGMGANATFYDATFLCDRLADVAAGRKNIPEAIGEYEAAMRSFAYPIIAMAADHDTQFGGGAITRAEATGRAP